MEHEDSFDESQNSTKSVKGKRGILWGNAETSALIKIWGEAEVTYALSSLKRNYEIFELISKELSKIGFHRSPEECRTKTKSLRKLYKQAVLHNSTSGSGRSKFIWFDEMAQIFRTDNSIHPLRTTESEAAAERGAESMEDSGEVVLSLDLLESNDYLLSSVPDESGKDALGSDFNEPTTSGCSTALSSATNSTENSRTADPRETTNFEATLDPARRLAMLRKRKQRASAATKLDSTLSGFVDWVQRNTESNNGRRNDKDEADKWFQKQVISNLRVASTSLKMLAEFITSSSSEWKDKSSVESDPEEIPIRSKTAKQPSQEELLPSLSSRQSSAINALPDSEAETVNNLSTGNDTDSDLEETCSQSLLETESGVGGEVVNQAVLHSTPTDEFDQQRGNGERDAVGCSFNKQGPEGGESGELNDSQSPYVIVKKEMGNKVPRVLRTPVKRMRRKRQIFSP